MLPYPSFVVPHPTTIMQQQHQCNTWIDKGSYYEYTLKCEGYDASGIKVRVDDRHGTLQVKGIARRHKQSQTSSFVSVSEFKEETTIPSDAVMTSLYAQMLNGQLSVTVEKQSSYAAIE